MDKKIARQTDRQIETSSLPQYVELPETILSSSSSVNVLLKQLFSATLWSSGGSDSVGEAHQGIGWELLKGQMI